ncbi:hypothetical protein Plhal304r1_c010g0039191 [Plasmopara halstedii]
MRLFQIQILMVVAGMLLAVGEVESRATVCCLCEKYWKASHEDMTIKILKEDIKDLSETFQYFLDHFKNGKTLVEYASECGNPGNEPSGWLHPQSDHNKYNEYMTFLIKIENSNTSNKQARQRAKLLREAQQNSVYQ